MTILMTAIDDSDTFQRMKKILTERGIRASEFQKKLKIKSQNWNNWRVRGIPHKQILRIAKELNINPEWLLEGDKAPAQGAEQELVAILQAATDAIEDSGLKLTKEEQMKLYLEAIELGAVKGLSEGVIRIYLGEILAKRNP